MGVVFEAMDCLHIVVIIYLNGNQLYCWPVTRHITSLRSFGSDAMLIATVPHLFILQLGWLIPICSVPARLMIE